MVLIRHHDAISELLQENIWAYLSFQEKKKSFKCFNLLLKSWHCRLSSQIILMSADKKEKKNKKLSLGENTKISLFELG